jgi:hypothetical protein
VAATAGRNSPLFGLGAKKMDQTSDNELITHVQELFGSGCIQGLVHIGLVGLLSHHRA